jgi:hypothetical protein
MMDYPTGGDVASARGRRAAGKGSESDVETDRFGTGQEMGLTGIPVAAAYEAAKPLLFKYPALNRLLGAVAGPEQMVDETTQRPDMMGALRNVGAVSAGALSNSRPGRAALELVAGLFGHGQ